MASTATNTSILGNPNQQTVGSIAYEGAFIVWVFFQKKGKFEKVTSLYVIVVMRPNSKYLFNAKVFWP